MVTIFVKALVIFCVIMLLLSLGVRSKKVQFSFKDIVEMSDKEIETACELFPRLAFKIKVLRGIHNISEKYNSQVDQFYDNMDNYGAKSIIALQLYIKSTKELIKEHLLAKVDVKYFKKKLFQSDKSWFFGIFDKNQLALIYSSIELIDKLLDGEDLLEIDFEPIFEKHYNNIRRLKI